jgi:hypothetical protein
MRQERARPSSQTWSTFLHNHTHEIWACNFLPVTNLFFRSLLAFFIIELQSRKVVHVGVTRHLTDAWVAQQLREATPYGQAPRFLTGSLPDFLLRLSNDRYSFVSHS